MIRRLRPWLTLAVSGGMVACAEWAGSELRGPQLSIVPLIAIGSGTILLDDLDQLPVVVVPISSVGGPGAARGTTVPVDAAGHRARRGAGGGHRGVNAVPGGLSGE